MCVSAVSILMIFNYLIDLVVWTVCHYLLIFYKLSRVTVSNQAVQNGPHLNSLQYNPAIVLYSHTFTQHFQCRIFTCKTVFLV